MDGTNWIIPQFQQKRKCLSMVLRMTGGAAARSANCRKFPTELEAQNSQEFKTTTTTPLSSCKSGDLKMMQSTWSKTFSPNLSSLEWTTPFCIHLARELPSCSFSRLAFFLVGIHVDLNPRSFITDESSSPAEKGKDRHIQTFLLPTPLAELGFLVSSHFYIPLAEGKTEKRFIFSCSWTFKRENPSKP